MQRLPILLAFALALAGFALMPCHAQEAPSASDDPITIIGKDYVVQAPDEIPSGWTTIEYTNEGAEPHALIIRRIPGSDTNPKEAKDRYADNLPKWYFHFETVGGSGLLDPGLTSEMTLNLKPGTYVLERSVKPGDGELFGMEEFMGELAVTDASLEAAPPEPDINIILSGDEFTIDGELSVGTHNVAVHLGGGGSGHNVHVARLDSDRAAQDVVAWMQSLERDGLRPPAPASFVGGIQQMQERQTGYFTLDLEPGRYLFVAENTGHLGVLQEVTVEP